MAGAKGRREERHGGERRGHYRDAQVAVEAVGEGADLVPHGAGVADEAARPGEHALPLGGEPHEARAAVDEEDAQALLQLLDPRRKRRLGHAAGLRRAPEMTLPGQGDEEFELVQHDALRMGDDRRRLLGDEGVGLVKH